MQTISSNYYLWNDIRMNPMIYLLNNQNMDEAVRRVKANKGAPGPDGMSTAELDDWMKENRTQLKQAISEKRYKPQPVRRVYIPKPNGKKRPLGIPNVTDRVVQQMAAQVLEQVFEPLFSEHSYGFRPGRSAHDAMFQALAYLNDGFTWIVDFDIEKFFDKVNHDKLISCVRREINDSTFLHLIRGFLKAGVMENGVKVKTEEGTPQGGPISPVLSGIYLTELDRELEQRNLRFVRYADDFLIFVKSKAAANRVMDSVTRWIEKKLFLKVSAEKTKVVRPMKCKFLGFSFWKSGKEWKCCPHKDSQKRLKDKIRKILCRRKAVNISLAILQRKLAYTIRGWINYYSIGDMKDFLRKTGKWLRHKFRVVIMKKWKKRGTIFRKLMRLWKKLPAYRKAANPDKSESNASEKSDADLDKNSTLSRDFIFAQCFTRSGWYQLADNSAANFILIPEVLEFDYRVLDGKDGRPGLINPLRYYEDIRERYKKTWPSVLRLPCSVAFV
jgi:group II intron reverse transcriptase/maturase